MQPIYSAQRPMNVAALFSDGASAVRCMLRDPNCGELYHITGAATHNPKASAIDPTSKDPLTNYINVEPLPEPAAYFEQQGLEPKKRDSRYRYWEHVLRILEQFEPDVIALSGLMMVVRYPLITEVDKNGNVRKGAFENCVLSVHPADLALLTDPSGMRMDASNAKTSDAVAFMKNHGMERKYKGGDAVTDALREREPYVRSTIHIVTQHLDEGPILVRSAEVDASAVRLDDAKKLQEYMKWNCDGPAFAEAIELAATHRLGVDETGTVFMMQEDKAWYELPYGGYTMEGRLVPEIK